MNDKHVPKGSPNGGQFARKDGSDQEKLTRAVRKYSDDSERDLKEMGVGKKKNKSKKEFFGEEFKGVKGRDAVEKLLKERRGHVKNAFERKELGGIDLVWGDEKGGLLHTIQKRDRLLSKGKGTFSGLQMAKKIPEIVEKGEFDIDELGRPGFIFDGCRVAVRPTYYDEKLNWIVTSFEIWE